MGLGDIVSEENKSHEKRQYPDHKIQDRLEEVIDKYRPRFPGGVNVEFIEVSPRITDKDGYAYYDSGGYIRVSKETVETLPWYYIDCLIAHEMVHLWMDQNGYDYSDGDRIFNWVCGQVGADVTKIGPKSEQYEIIREFKNINPR